MARVLTVVWMLSGLVTQGLFVAAVTMSLVSQSLDVDFKLYGNKVKGINVSMIGNRKFFCGAYQFRLSLSAS